MYQDFSRLQRQTENQGLPYASNESKNQRQNCVTSMTVPSMDFESTSNHDEKKNEMKHLRSFVKGASDLIRFKDDIDHTRRSRDSSVVVEDNDTSASVAATATTKTRDLELDGKEDVFCRRRKTRSFSSMLTTSTFLDSSSHLSSGTTERKSANSGSEVESALSISKIWERIIRPQPSVFDVCQFGSTDEKPPQSFLSSLRQLYLNATSRLHVFIRQNSRILKSHRYIPVSALLFLTLTLAASVGTTLYLAKKYKDEKHRVAYHYGIMGRQLLADQMETTIESLHALLHGVHDNQVLLSLPHLIDARNGDVASHDNGIMIRNVTGVCDVGTLVNSFSHNASVIRHAAYLHGVVIHRVTLVPYGVVCVTFPNDWEGSEYEMGHDMMATASKGSDFDMAIKGDGALFSGPFLVEGESWLMDGGHGGEGHDSHSDGGHENHGDSNEHNGGNNDNHTMDEEHNIEGDHIQDQHGISEGHDTGDGHRTEHDLHGNANVNGEDEHAHDGHITDGNTSLLSSNGNSKEKHGHNGDLDVSEQHNSTSSYWIWKLTIPIKVPYQSYSFDDHWGTMEVLVDWDEFLNESGIAPFFDQHSELEFVITRPQSPSLSETSLHGDSSRHNSQYSHLAVSNGAEAINSHDFIHLELNYRDAQREQWRLSVGVRNGFRPPWYAGAILLSVIISFFVSLMFLLALLMWQGHKDLLSEILPRKALQMVMRGETYVEHFDMVTVFFSDIVGYTTLSAEMSPIRVVEMLNEYYGEVDKLVEKHGVYKAETIGDAYICLGGCPNRSSGSQGAQQIALFALDLIELVKNFRFSSSTTTNEKDESSSQEQQILVRCGINSGPLVAGVVGSKVPKFSVYGDVVNAASRMESTSEAMRIQCSETTYRLLRDASSWDFDMTPRGGVDVKGKGRMDTWWIKGAKRRAEDAQR